MKKTTPTVLGPQTKRHPEKGGKLNTSQAVSVTASRAAVGQFPSLFRVATWSPFPRLPPFFPPSFVQFANPQQLSRSLSFMQPNLAVMARLHCRWRRCGNEKIGLDAAERGARLQLGHLGLAQNLIPDIRRIPNSFSIYSLS